MLTVNKLIPGARGLASVLLKRAARVELDWDVRQKSRFDATDSQGLQLGVFLPNGTAVRGGDVLVAEDGSLIQVLPAPQPVLLVRHCQQHGSSLDLTRAAYHLGRRQVQLELQTDHLKLQPNPVLAKLLRGMHLIVSEEVLTFEPEAGSGPTPGHGRGLDHDHASEPQHEPHPAHLHDHPHSHASAPAAPAARRPLAIPVKAAAAPHVHGPGCGHDHGDHDH